MNNTFLSRAAGALVAVTLWAASAAAQTRPDLDCRAEQGLPSKLVEAPILLVGELHGSQEVPWQVGEWACRRLQAGRGVILALEVPASEQPALDAFLRSDGGADARARLLAGAFWQRAADQQDGRSSGAMLALVERARVLAAATGQLRLLAMDAADPQADRDAAMAEAVRGARHAAAGYQVLALAGNLHMPTLATLALGDMTIDRPLGHRLRGEGAIALLVWPLMGSFWACAPACGVQSVFAAPGPVREPGLQPGSTLLPGYDATLLMPRATASPPARGEAR